MTKRKKAAFALRCAGDTPEMKEAISMFEKKQKDVIRPSTIQLKSGLLNFYPSTGKITIDRAPSIKARGLKTLSKMLTLDLDDEQCIDRFLHANGFIELTFVTLPP